MERFSRAREQIFLSAFHRDDLRKHRHHRLLSYKAYLKLKTCNTCIKKKTAIFCIFVKNIFNTQTQNLKIRPPLSPTMGIAPSHFEEHQQREEEEQSAKALMMMNAHHARSISFGEEIPSDLECTICAEVRVYSFVSEITFLLGVTCFSRARARCFESAEGKKKRE